MSLNIAQVLEIINNRLSNIERRLNTIEEKVEFSNSIARNHLIRLKNGDPIDDQMILFGRPYNDLDPQTACKILNNSEQDYILLDVSTNGSGENVIFKESLHIPLEELPQRVHEIQTKTLPILVISEKGLKSIRACEFLVKKGFFNVNNISGGFFYWPNEKVINLIK